MQERAISADVNASGCISSPGHLLLVGIFGETPRVKLRKFEITANKISSRTFELHRETVLKGAIFRLF